MPRWPLACLLLATSVHADPITDRDYAIELYEGVAIGDNAQVGMGGAGAAVIGGSAGALMNPAAPAVRLTTDNDSWSVDYHIAALTGRFSTDYDNNGAISDAGSGAALATFGLALRVGDWAGAATFTVQTAPVDGSAPEVDAQSARFKLVFARYIHRWDLALGLGLQTVSFQLAPSAGGDEMFRITGTAGVAGLTWLPRDDSWRVSVAVESPIIGGTVETATCDPMSCQGYILPESVVSPGRSIVGGAYRFAPTAWNQQVTTRFRDERALIIATDLVVTGTSTGGNGIEAFGMQELQPAGRSVSISLRGGGELEALPGRLRVRAGSYWEPGRFDGVSGRIHGTFGIDLRALEFHAWGLRRGRLSAFTDIAPRYRNLGVSIGFWH